MKKNVRRKRQFSVWASGVNTLLGTTSIHETVLRRYSNLNDSESEDSSKSELVNSGIYVT